MTFYLFKLVILVWVFYQIRELILKHSLSIPPNPSALICTWILIYKPNKLNIFHSPIQVPCVPFFFFFNLGFCPKRLPWASLSFGFLLISRIGNPERRLEGEKEERSGYLFFLSLRLPCPAFSLNCSQSTLLCMILTFQVVMVTVLSDIVGMGMVRAELPLTLYFCNIIFVNSFL